MDWILIIVPFVLIIASQAYIKGAYNKYKDDCSDNQFRSEKGIHLVCNRKSETTGIDWHCDAIGRKPDKKGQSVGKT